MARTRKKVKDPAKVGADKIRKISRAANRNKRNQKKKRQFHEELPYVEDFEKIILRKLQFQQYRRIEKNENGLRAYKSNAAEGDRVKEISLIGMKFGTYMIHELLSM